MACVPSERVLSRIAVCALTNIVKDALFDETRPEPVLSGVTLHKAVVLSWT